MLLLALYIGALWRNARRGRAATQELADYLVGGRRLGGFVIGVSFFATFASTNSYVGHAGKGYELGLPWLLFPLFMAFFTWLSWTTVAPRLREASAALDALTLPDYFARRFDSVAIGRAAGCIVVFAAILYLVAIFKGAGHVLQFFLAVDYEVAVLALLVIVVLYTSYGGFVSVARTDVLQGLMMLLGAWLLAFFVFRRVAEEHALDALLTLPELAPLADWNLGLPFAVLVGIFLSGSLKLLVDPRQVSRFFALRDRRQLRLGMTVALVGLLLIQLGLFPIGLLAHLFMDDVGDTDLIVPMLLQRADVFPLWAADVLLIAIVSAAMSSMDSVLLVAASVWARDIQRVDAARGVGVTRIAIVALAIVAALVALRPPGDIVGITIFSGSLYAACFLPGLLFGLHTSRGDARAMGASMLVGVVVLLAWLGSGLGATLHEVFPALAASAVSFALLARRRGARDAAALDADPDAGGR
ncbi:MAG: sodium:solute symporter family protein [Pseudomonadota bacterium]